MATRGHVLIIVENLPVPFDARVWQESLALKEQGYDVSVICPKGASEYREGVQILDGILILRHNLPVEARGPFGYLAEYLSALFWQFRLASRLYRHRPFQVIQACNPPDLMHIVARHFKRKYGVAFVFDHHDLSPELYLAKFGRRDLGYRLMLHFERKTFGLADRSIATNESYRRIAIERGRMRPDLVTTVRSGPSLERMYPVPANARWKRNKRYMAAYVGVLGKQEGLPYLLEAARVIHFKRGFDELHIVVVGDGPELSRLKVMATALGIEDLIEFTGRICNQDLREVLSTADICINPDEYNEMNDKSTMNKVMEYMAMGKPIVQFDLTEGRFSAGESSLYCRRNDAEDLAEKMLWLLSHADERDSMGGTGRLRVLHELSWDHEKPKYVAVYRSIFDRNSSTTYRDRPIRVRAGNLE